MVRNKGFRGRAIDSSASSGMWGMNAKATVTFLPEQRAEAVPE